MLLPRNSQYAISAMLRLADLPAGAFVRVEDLVRDTPAPRHAVAKVLHELAKRGFLESARGTGGGYRLAEDARQRRLIEIVEAISGPHSTDAIATRGLALVGEQCKLMRLFEPVARHMDELLHSTTIDDLLNIDAVYPRDGEVTHDR